MKYIIAILLACFASTAVGQQVTGFGVTDEMESFYCAQQERARIDADRTRKSQQAQIDQVDEIKKLRQEIALLRQLLEKLLANQLPPKPAGGKVWKQVRPVVQLEGGIDDGYELVDDGPQKRKE